uniref:Uncharacterized protein n=1 Tax=Daphnia galeata TaxID=27404 RepID=A0A8J2RDG0_9CRUS|nr:unnamed protein product [Daphnia galeata]
MEQSIQTCQHKVPDQFEIDFESAFSKISIIPNYPLLKHLSPNSPPNMPTRYETVGILDGGINIVDDGSFQLKYHFSLRNLSRWNWNDEALPDMLKCVYYTSRKDFASCIPIETNIWVSGYFLPSGLFVVCSEIRLATDSDIAALAYYGIP